MTWTEEDWWGSAGETLNDRVEETKGREELRREYTQLFLRSFTIRRSRKLGKSVTQETHGIKRRLFFT